MTEFNYILSYNPNLVNPTYEALHIFVTQNRDISSWYLAFLGTYILKSSKPLSQLNGQFGQLFGGNPFILNYAPREYTTGSLPPEIWQWFNGTQNPFLTSE